MSLPPSSPRLPSPPPTAEIQIGPKSPSVGTTASHQVQQMEQSAIDANAKRRVHPATKASDMAAGPPLIPLNELDSAFQLQEHLAALHYHHTASNTIPMSREATKILATPPPGIDRTLWLYELCRFLIAQCNSLIVGFLFDTPPCSAATCPEMRAGEWQFLCAVHDPPRSCCAIDYCCHTLDWAANVVTNPKIFPSRFVALADAHDKGAALKNLINVFRRLHRIFAHAWFQHRGVFWAVEGQTGLYIFFKSVCDTYDLLPAEIYKLPPEAEGLETPGAANGAAAAEKKGQPPQQQQQPPQPTSIMVKPGAAAQRPGGADEDGFAGVSRTNTRRHIKSSPSTGSAVPTVIEADEDESAAVANKLKELQITAPEIAEEGDEDGEAGEAEMADVPVIVEHGVVEDDPETPSTHKPAAADLGAGDGEVDRPKEESEHQTTHGQSSDSLSEPDAKEEGKIERPAPEHSDEPAEGSGAEATEAKVTPPDPVQHPGHESEAKGDDEILEDAAAHAEDDPAPSASSTHDFAVENTETASLPQEEKAEVKHEAEEEAEKEAEEEADEKENKPEEEETEPKEKETDTPSSKPGESEAD